MRSRKRSRDAPLGEPLLDWYRMRRGAYPWRRSRDPYSVLVSEVMLQQTQASRVAPAFERFLAAFPTVERLAAAGRADVVRAWDGLGYNRRAVALSEAAKAIVRDHGGAVPRDLDALRGLPGVGPYTAAAVASIAFGVPVPAVDTNVRRIVTRFHLGSDADELPPARIRELADAWLDRAAPGAWNQALMDLGRTVCRPRPRCSACPLVEGCRFPKDAVQPRSPNRRQPPFEGSTRQVRGAVVRALRERSPSTLGTVAARTGFELARVVDAVRDLHREGLLDAGTAALEGRVRGSVRLAG